jgi:hypothetical protein
MKYAIVQKMDPESLVQIVNESLEKGWECQGGLTTIFDNRSGTVMYVQALVKKEKTKKTRL